MVIENAYALEEIKLGRRGENQARKVVFDVLGKWREGYGEGVASLIVQRNGDAQPYPVTLAEEDGALVWLVSSADTAVAGEGAAELRYTVGDTVVKSQIYKTRVRETLEDSGETPPPAYQSWVDEVLQAAAEVQGTKEYADNAKVSADAAAESAAKAASTADGVNDKVAEADASAKAAASSAAAAAESVTGIDEKVQAAQTAADNAAKSETAAKDAQTAAANAQKAAESSQTGAQSAKTAAESAQEAAESAKNAAADSSTAAGQKATQAAQSAEDAASAKSAAETAKTDAQAARDAIVNMIVDAVALETGKPATVTKSLVDNVYKLVFGLPKGETGAPGPRGATGNGISDIALKSGTHAPGTSDVYTITLTDGTTYDFAVYNGANGAGAGDMLAAVYDPQGKHQDIFAYIDEAIKGVSITTDATPTQGSTKPVQSGGVYSALANKLDKTGNGSNVTAAFTAATTRANVATGEKLSVLFGKIAKWFTDLKSLAFKDTVAKTDLESAVQGLLLPDGGTTGQVVTKTADGQEWADAAGGVFWIDCTVDDETGSVTYTQSKDDILNASKSGRLCILNLGRKYPVLVKSNPYNAGAVMEFTGVKNGKYGASLATIYSVTLNASSGMMFALQTNTVPYGPTEEAMLKGDGSGGLAAAVAETDYASPTIARKVALTVAGWNSSTKQQTVACTGILADATAQEIRPMPVDTSYESAWNTCGIQAVAQAANSLTFQCSDVPTTAVEVYVTIRAVNYQS